MLGITEYAWRLIPANPILLRVVESGGKRKRDLFIRCGYLGLLVALVVFSIATLSGSDLGSLAKTSASLFQKMAYLQLGLTALLAPIFTAGAITQEKDSQTYDILLATPLTNAQIVLGSLLSRLFFIIALLVSGIPIFSITQIFGGVAIRSIVVSFGIAASTAFVTGSLAMAIATFKVGTRRTIFSFYLFIVIYLAGGWVLDQFEAFQVAGRTIQQGVASHVSWFTGINPFLALRVIFNDPTYVPPGYDDLPVSLRGWPVGWYLTNPTGFYVTFMFLLSFLLVMPSILLLRRMAQSTTSLKTLVLQKLKIVSGDKTRKPRYVWSNPIAWREAKTKASAARATVLRYGFIAAGIIGAIFLCYRFAQVQPAGTQVTPAGYDADRMQLTIESATYRVPPEATVEVQLDAKDIQTGAYRKQPFHLGDLRQPMELVSITPPLPQRGTQLTVRSGPLILASLVVQNRPRLLGADDARRYLLGAAIVELAVILLIVTNAAASTVTREKEDGTLDLLLSSPITSRYYIWGKLRGLVSFILPLVAVPVASVSIFVIYDIFRRISDWNDPLFEWTVLPEAVVLMPLMLVIVSAFAAILGMQMSLRCRTTVMAVMSSVGIVVGACAAMGWCGYAMLTGNSNTFSLVAGSFSPFTLMQMLIAPSTAGTESFRDITADDLSGRLPIIFCTLIAVGAYTAVVWSMYTSMVKNFDMTIRRQSR